MFEFDAGHEIASSNSLPQVIIDEFASSRFWIEALTIIPWEEHCTECAMPHCYITCDLYEPRKDGKCRRFVGGITPIYGIPSLLGYAAKIQFKPWGQLLAYSHQHLVPAAAAEKIFRISLKLDDIVAQVPDYNLSVFGRRGISSRIMRRLKQYMTSRGFFAESQDRTPDCLLLEIYNPNDSIVKLTLVGRDTNGPLKDYPFQQLIELKRGFTREMIPYQDVASHISRDKEFHLSICPNIKDPSAQGPTLFFGLLSFVKWRTKINDKQEPHEENKLKPVKVLIWDLDNTIWKGILIEDGKEKLALREGVVEVIDALDRRGIVNSIASKNNCDDAKLVLQELGLIEYFVFPRFSWSPKSESIREIVDDFNVGEDTIAFIDDSPFEREEVSRSFPKIRVFDALESGTLLALPDFSPPVSEESHLRRYYYKNEEKRQQKRVSYGSDYSTFLRDCFIKLNITTVEDHNSVDRVTELIQRTNQLNFSGNRYTREQIVQMLNSGVYDAYRIHCEDRFGDYGLIGFCLVDRKRARIVDLMFSCRVQSKQVEHAFLRSFLGFQKSKGVEKVEVVYRSNSRNLQLGKVFADLGFQLEPSGSDPSEQLFSFNLQNDISPESIVEVVWHGYAND